MAVFPQSHTHFHIVEPYGYAGEGRAFGARSMTVSIPKCRPVWSINLLMSVVSASTPECIKLSGCYCNARSNSAAARSGVLNENLLKSNRGRFSIAR